jgi:hypothetical protein
VGEQHGTPTELKEASVRKELHFGWCSLDGLTEEDPQQLPGG